MNNVCISPSGTGATTILFNKISQVNKLEFDNNDAHETEIVEQ